MMNSRKWVGLRAAAAASLFVCLGIATAPAQQPDDTSVIQMVDAAVKARVDHLAGYTVTEHYAVYRDGDESHPAAEMTVKTTYNKESGKSYAILSSSGSELIRKFVLDPLLENEKALNLPGNRESSWITSANYDFKLKPGGPQPTDGRACLALALTPRRKAPNMIEGTLWVDASDGTIVRLEGIATKSPSVFTGPAHMMRQYVNMSGYGMATHARAESDSFLFGRTVVTIEYLDYQMQLLPVK